jgi:hypothetical protein
MKKVCTSIILALFCLLPQSACSSSENAALPDVRDGDIIFNKSNSGQSQAIQLATKSAYTHCGLILYKDGKPYVLEAARTVTYTPLNKWIEYGKDKHYVIMRLKDSAALTPEVLASIKEQAGAFTDKRYDLLFQWSDDKIYCSELVWKIFERGANISLVPLRTFRDYKLDDPAVQAKIKERFGSALPLDEKVVAPSDLMASPLLEITARTISK